jgi:hypothetical protein
MPQIPRLAKLNFKFVSLTDDSFTSQESRANDILLPPLH